MLVATSLDVYKRQSLARTEATGYGLCYFAKEMLADAGKSFEGQRVVISGSGNVATYANQKATQMGGKVIAMSDSNGYIVDENGIDYKVIKEIKEVKQMCIRDSTYLTLQACKAAIDALTV